MYGSIENYHLKPKKSTKHLSILHANFGSLTPAREWSLPCCRGSREPLTVAFWRSLSTCYSSPGSSHICGEFGDTTSRECSWFNCTHPGLLSKPKFTCRRVQTSKIFVLSGTTKLSILIPFPSMIIFESCRSQSAPSLRKAKAPKNVQMVVHAKFRGGSR